MPSGAWGCYKTASMRLRLVPFIAAAALLSSCEAATTPPPVRSTADALWNEAQGRPQLLSGRLFRGEGDAEATARAFLSSRAGELHLDGPGLSLALDSARAGLAGTYLRFGQRQRVGDEVLPVFDGAVIVLVQDAGGAREVRAVNLEHLEAATGVVSEGDLGADAAVERALGHLALAGAPEAKAAKGVLVTKAGLPRVAWRVQVSTEAPPHDWSLFVDAATGAELLRRDGVRFVDGTAYVFDMNPVASTGNLALVDGNDATTPALDAARFLVTLPRLDGSGNTSGTWANVYARTAARVNSPTNEFLFTRNQLGFEQANVYFHLDRAQARLQALGFTAANNRQQEAIVDGQTADNSYYAPSSQRLFFGRGGVDDAEDADIIVHEYGHALQDNLVPGFGGGDEGAMGEGFGDYLAASFALSLTEDAGRPQRGDPACVGDWDGTSYATTTPKCLRRVDGTKHYPEAEVNQVHDDGEMWSAALWDLRTRLGGDVMDRLVVESHLLLGTTTTFATASQALISTDATLNGGANATVLRRRLVHSGLSRLLSAPLDGGATTPLPIGLGPTRDAAGNYRSNADESRTVTVPGALGLRVHFDRIDLETHPSCFQQSCDNLYLLNGEGDLFQVFGGGPRSDVTSVIVPGDTVVLRFVSDASAVKYGFRVDRLEVVDAPPDAGIVYDGGMDTTVPPPLVDAGVPVRDGGAPMRDGGVPGRDGGLGFDGGAPPAPVDAGVSGAGGAPFFVPALREENLLPALDRGCGCGATSGLEAWAALAALGVINRRRR